jgi:type IV pilus assembly protein PilO
MASYDLNNIHEWPRPMRYLLILLVFVLVFYGGYYFDLTALSRRVLSVQQQESSIKQQLEIVYGKKAATENEISQLPALKGTLAVWQDKLAKPKDLPELLHQILKVGMTNQLQFVFFNPGIEHKVGIYSTQPLKLVVVGSYHQIANFVSQVANMPTIVVVKDFTIIKGDSEILSGQAAALLSNNAPDHLTAEFLLEVYHIDQQS